MALDNLDMVVKLQTHHWGDLSHGGVDLLLEVAESVLLLGGCG